MVKWKHDEDVIEELGYYRLAWQETAVDISEIDEAASLLNCARGEAINAELVEDYASAMEDGDTFPCIVLCRVNSESRYTIVSGNHRFAAAKRLSETVFPAICFKATNEQFLDIAIALNRKHGQRVDRKTRIQQAVRMVKLGRTQTDAARLLGVTADSIQMQLRVESVNEAFTAAGFPRIEVTASIAKSIAGLCEQTALVPMLHRLISTKPTSAEIAHITKLVKSKRTEAARISAIADEVEKRLQSGGKNKPVSRPVAQRLRASITIIEAAVEKGEQCKFQITAVEMKEMQVRLNRCAIRLGELARGAGN